MACACSPRSSSSPSRAAGRRLTSSLSSARRRAAAAAARGPPGGSGQPSIANVEAPEVTAVTLDPIAPAGATERTGEIGLAYEVHDKQGLAVSVRIDFSQDGGATFAPATVDRALGDA